MITIKCTNCGKDLVRTNRTKNAVCFDCKKEKAKERYENRRKTGPVGIPVPDNYEISDEEIQKRLAKIRKDNLIIKQSKVWKLDNKLK